MSTPKERRQQVTNEELIMVCVGATGAAVCEIMNELGIGGTDGNDQQHRAYMACGLAVGQAQERLEDLIKKKGLEL